MAPCDFWLFPKLKGRWKGPDFSQEKTLCGTRQPRCTWFHKKLSRNVSSNGRTAGRSVCITKETTLKEIRVSNVKINNCIFADQRSDTFCTAHVDSGSDKTQVLTSLDMNCTKMGLISAMLRISTTAKFNAGVCTLLSMLITFQVQDAFHATSHSPIQEHHSCPQHGKISGNICFSPAYYPIRAR